MPRQQRIAYLGLGSNVGRRCHFLAEAIQGIAAIEGVEMLRVSDLYESPAWGVEDQPDFLNMVIAVRVRLSPAQLLSRIKDLERQLGRTRREKWGPREIDVDILLFGDLQIDRPDLTIPHPYITQRQFVLVPLARIAPDVHVAPDATAADLADPDTPDLTRLGPFEKVLEAEGSDRASDSSS